MLNFTRDDVKKLSSEVNEPKQICLMALRIHNGDYLKAKLMFSSHHISDIEKAYSSMIERQKIELISSSVFEKMLITKGIFKTIPPKKEILERDLQKTKNEIRNSPLNSVYMIDDEEIFLELSNSLSRNDIKKFIVKEDIDINIMMYGAAISENFRIDPHLYSQLKPMTKIILKKI